MNCGESFFFYWLYAQTCVFKIELLLLIVCCCVNFFFKKRGSCIVVPYKI